MYSISWIWRFKWTEMRSEKKTITDQPRKLLKCLGRIDRIDVQIHELRQVCRRALFRAIPPRRQPIVQWGKILRHHRSVQQGAHVRRNHKKLPHFAMETDRLSIRSWNTSSIACTTSSWLSRIFPVTKSTNFEIVVSNVWIWWEMRRIKACRPSKRVQAIVRGESEDSFLHQCTGDASWQKERQTHDRNTRIEGWRCYHCDQQAVENPSVKLDRQFVLGCYTCSEINNGDLIPSKCRTLFCSNACKDKHDRENFNHMDFFMMGNWHEDFLNTIFRIHGVWL